eukprot:317678-Prymnesium_polylepis.2
MSSGWWICMYISAFRVPYTPFLFWADGQERGTSLQGKIRMTSGQCAAVPSTRCGAVARASIRQKRRHATEGRPCSPSSA